MNFINASRYGDEVKPRAVSSNAVETIFSLVRSKRPVFTVASGLACTKVPFWSKINARQDRETSKIERQTGKQEVAFSCLAFGYCLFSCLALILDQNGTLIYASPLTTVNTGRFERARENACLLALCLRIDAEERSFN